MTAEHLREVEAFLHDRIPLTQAMGLRVVEVEGDGFVIEAPVALNSNHLQAAFGGSINAVATLAGYGSLWMELRAQKADVVVRDSSIRFLRPIRETIRAVCARPQPAELRRFHSTLRAKGKARITQRVRVEENGFLAAEFEGTFIALRRPSAEPSAAPQVKD